MSHATAPTILQRIAAVALALAGVIMAAEGWEALTTPQGVGGLLSAAAGAILGIYGHRPRLPRAPR